MERNAAEHALVALEQLLATPQDIVEHIMTQHWDLAACRCWVCRAGQRLGLHPMAHHLRHHMPMGLASHLTDVTVAEG